MVFKLETSSFIQFDLGFKTVSYVSTIRETIVDIREEWIISK